MELLITGVILIVAMFILYKNLNKARKGQCTCSSKNCSSCPKTLLKVSRDKENDK
ncbi:FeoB-associated Cys-rich membrane protein [Clostridium frigidicarnis]|uniref:Virus attachment protein p12 family protein n=1 Tax=Clostridium frigidicarnis TaxID=84698 RepID=A0A1I0ZAM2_9CLOT|nr:FeoB-associated Cys-rich membrane protein [Clostridium frigidicarnis]SFB22685.1 hypothetical protein SAMN04488528_101915 [Clostridium frigidicarnis]